MLVKIKIVKKIFSRNLTKSLKRKAITLILYLKMNLIKNKIQNNLIIYYHRSLHNSIILKFKNNKNLVQTVKIPIQVKK